MPQKKPCFNVRVYGIILNDQQQVLLTDEFQLGMKMTKFPGGGLHFGEGTRDCLQREALEEFGQQVDVLEHFYTLDYYQPSYFYQECQLLSIYYKAAFKEPVRFSLVDEPFDGREDLVDGFIAFRWKQIADLQPDDLTLPVDKVVANMLGKQA